MTQSRTHNCNELRLSNAGEKVTLVGWYENLRKVSKNLGFLILRDFYGTTQIVVETEEMMEKLDGVNKESTISVTGTVRERSNKNTELPTGEIEVVPEGIEILGKCIYNALPFEINQSREADENTRLKYRYLDLRNPSVKSKIVLRSRIVAELRNKMNELGFLEITTPILTCSSPEGARDYLVPARNHPGKFYALPQAPQQFKQILMASGFDRYFQIAPCFRDEDAWRWHLLPRRMCSLLSRRYCRRYLKSMVYTRLLPRLRLCVFHIWSPWTSTAPTSRISALIWYCRMRRTSWQTADSVRSRDRP